MAMPQNTAAKTAPLRAAFDEISRLFQTGQLMLANQKLEEALVHYSDNVNFLHLGGLIKQNVGEVALAEKMLRTAQALRPDEPDIVHNLAVFLLARGGAAEAAPLFEKLTHVAPSRAHVWVNWGHALRQNNEMNKALAAFKKAKACESHPADLDGLIAMTERQLGIWDGAALPQEKVSANLAPVFLDDPFAHLACVKKGAASIRPAARFEARPLPRAGRLRIGYLSNDLHDHATSHLIAELFGLHNREDFEVFVYSYGPDDQSAIRARMKEGAEHWVECAGQPSALIAERIFRDRIAILIDMKGYTRGALPEVLAARPAPVIVQWLGYPGSMGADFVDYIVADPYLIPDELRAAYSEKIIALPNSYQMNDRRRPLPPAKPRAAYGLPEGKTILTCFNQIYKITPPVFDVWMRVMKDHPETALWLFATHAEAIACIKAEAKKRGIDSARLVFAQRAPQADHLARYHHADLILDTLPYGGHTTISDALWMAAPVVGLSGRSFAARVSGSLLTAAGLPQLITHNLNDYEAKIRALLAAPDERMAIRATLQKNRETSVLFDAPRFVKGLEDAYRQIARRYEAGGNLIDVKVEAV